MTTGAEEEIVESDKKRMRDGRSKEGSVIDISDNQNTNENHMQTDGNTKLMQSKSTDEVHGKATENIHFLSASPGSQDCREQ